MERALLAYLVTVLLFGFSANVKAEWVFPEDWEPESSYTFWGSAVKNQNGNNSAPGNLTDEMLKSFRFVVESLGGQLVQFSFYVDDPQLLAGKDGIKFKDFAFDPSSLSSLFTSTNFNWDPTWVNWNSATGEAIPMKGQLTLVADKSWSDLAQLIEEDAFSFKLHVQSINGDGFTSLNLLHFDKTPRFRGFENDDPSSTPEPATLLILGLGVVGAGIAARRQQRK